MICCNKEMHLDTYGMIFRCDICNRIEDVESEYEWFSE